MLPDEIGEVGDWRGVGDPEAVAEVIPEGDALFGAGLHEAEEGVAGLAAGLGAGAAGDLAAGDAGADVVLRAVGVEGDLGMLEDEQQFVLVGVEPRQQPVQGGEVGAGREDVVETPDKLASPPPGRPLAVGLEVGVEPLDPRPDPLLGLGLPSGEAVQPVHQPLGVDPAERMIPDLELPGVVAEDDAARQQPMAGDAAPERAQGWRS